MRALLTAALLLLASGSAFAQQSILFSLDSDELTLFNGNGLTEAGLLRQDEVGIVTPKLGFFYSAQTFLSMSTQWALLGDADGDGKYVNDATEAPGDRIDALLVKRFMPLGSTGIRDVYFSKETGDGFGGTFMDGDVFRFLGPVGGIETFVSESQLLDAIGQPTIADLDTDAIAQDSAGNLYVSFADNELISGVLANDGALIYIPKSAITYDANGNIASIVIGSGVIAAEENHLQAMVAASGMKTAAGGVVGTSANELTALEIDPNGGTWNPPLKPTLTLPNLLFAWQGASDDGAILSTAGGGSIPLLNGVPLADPVATTGLQIGMLPTSTGISGIDGLALIPTPAQVFACENYPRNFIDSQPAWHRIEFSGATPLSTIYVMVDFGPTTPGGALLSLVFPPFGELFILGPGALLLGAVTADADGFASFTILMNYPVLNGANLVFQGFDASTLQLSQPAALQFQ